MTWFRPARRPGLTRRPRLEALEERTLLSLVPDLYQASQPFPAQTAQATPGIGNPSFDHLIGSSAVRLTYGVDGSGLSAATIDTGVDYYHPALGGRFGPGQKVFAGYDFAMNDPDPLAETWSHGTMVAGLIASKASNAAGVAPGAGLVPLRVFGNDNKGSFDLIADGLQWVIDHHEEHRISVVNVSLSDGGNYKSDPFFLSGVGRRLLGLIDTLNDLNIPVVAASGNSFDGHSQGMGYLAILPGTISVTASDSSGQLMADAQRLGPELGGSSATDLVAPGSGLLTTVENGGFAQVEGTSFAAPLVSGSILLLQEIYLERFGELPRVSDLETWLKQGGDPVHDPATGQTFSRLNLVQSASLIPGAPSVSPNPNPSTDSDEQGKGTEPPTPSEPPASKSPSPIAEPAPSKEEPAPSAPPAPVDEQQPSLSEPESPSTPPKKPEPDSEPSKPTPDRNVTPPPPSGSQPPKPSDRNGRQPSSRQPESPAIPPQGQAVEPPSDKSSPSEISAPIAFWTPPEPSPLRWTVWGPTQIEKTSPGQALAASLRAFRLSQTADSSTENASSQTSRRDALLSRAPRSAQRAFPSRFSQRLAGFAQFSRLPRGPLALLQTRRLSWLQARQVADRGADLSH